ncbi:MAG: FAD-binding oxidoreductase, partial [Desulfuromonadales bacterium]|nr:FAD-binding oxidoreductase [Desulfuromonadales bacterium]
MTTRTAIQQLQNKLGEKNVYFEPEDLLVLGYDSTPGVHHLPEVVVYPTTTEQVVAAMAIA